MTGGTSGSKETLEKLSQSGVGTIVGMHMSEDHRKEAEKHHLNVVIAGHIASDTLGLNLLLDALEKHGNVHGDRLFGIQAVRHGPEQYERT